MFDKLTRINYRALSQPTVLLISVASFIVIAIADYLTTYKLRLTPFYILTILFVTWNCGSKWGLGFVFASLTAQITISRLTAYPYFDSIYFYLDNINRLIVYLIVFALTARLSKQTDREQYWARVDYLTGLLNQRGFYSAFSIEIARHRRDQCPIAVAYLDCDNFKQVNDNFGHKEGDRLLKVVAQTMKANLRETDMIGRLGGDEFAVVLPDSNRASAFNVIDKLRRELDATMKQHSWPVTFSIGLAIFPKVLESDDEMICFSDKLMYRVKASGKNNLLVDLFAISVPATSKENN